MNAYAGSIADLLADAKRRQAQGIVSRANILAQGQQRLAGIAANDVLQRRQNDPFSAILQTIQGSLGDYLRYSGLEAAKAPAPAPTPDAVVGVAWQPPAYYSSPLTTSGYMSPYARMAGRANG